MRPGRRFSVIDMPAIGLMLAAILSSNAFAVWLTQIFQHRKQKAETARTTIESALALEARAVERYQTTAEALDAAEKLLKYAQAQLLEQELYIETLQRLLDKARISYPAPNRR